jgi:nucleotide-binding universal stress UspA family protein
MWIAPIVSPAVLKYIKREEGAMSLVKHILFPVDFSERSQSAAPFVAEMARRQDAKVTLIAVAQRYFSGGFEGPPPIDPQFLLESVKSQLDSAFLSEFAGLKVDRMVELGDPAQIITEFAAANKVDLVMMPSHGYGPFRQVLLGSVTAKVLHDAHVPVWTSAHTGAEPADEHLVLRNILCAVDASPASIDLMRWGARLAKSLGATLRLVHAVPTIEAWPERPMNRDFEENLRENARHTIQNLEQAADIEVPVCVCAGMVADVVHEEALQHQADLLLIGRGALQQSLGRLRTHSYGIIHNAPCPVLSV